MSDFTIFEAEELENDETIFAELTRDLDSDCDVTISVTFRSFSQCKWHGVDAVLVLIITIFEFEEHKSDETIHVELNRDLVSECDVTISVTCPSYSYSNANDTILMLVSILPYFEVEELENEARKWRTTRAWPNKWLTSRCPWPVRYLIQMTQYRYTRNT